MIYRKSHYQMQQVQIMYHHTDTPPTLQETMRTITSITNLGFTKTQFKSTNLYPGKWANK